jgi:hypothetical protein
MSSAAIHAGPVRFSALPMRPTGMPPRAAAKTLTGTGA